jgi:hypothetical protein
MSKIKKTATWLIVTVPFVISAAIEFLPPWLYWPICIVFGMVWIGAFITIGEKENETT